MRRTLTQLAVTLLSFVTGCSKLIDLPQAFDEKGGDGGRDEVGGASSGGSGGKSTKEGTNPGAQGGTPSVGGSTGSGAPQGGGTAGSGIGGQTNGGATHSGPPSIESFTAAYNKVCSGDAVTLRAVFKNGTATVDHNVGPIVSGVEKLTGAITASATYKLTVTGDDGQVLTASADVTALPSGEFTVTGAPKSLISPDSQLQRSGVLMPNGTVLLITQGPNSDTQLEQYDLSTGKFTTVGSVTPAHWGPLAQLDNSRVLLAGHAGTRADIFDLGDRTSVAVGPMSIERQFAQAVSLPSSRRVLIVGGSWPGINDARNTAELFDPGSGESGSFFLLSLQEGRARHTTTVLADGRVLVTGGMRYRSAPSATAEIYDPSVGTTGKFSLTGSMNLGRDLHSAVLLESGKVLVSGGYTLGTSWSDTWRAELYNPSTGQFTETGFLNTAREQHEMVLLKNGRVLVYGGTASNSPITSPEIYTEATGSFTAPVLSRPPTTFGTVTRLANGVVLIAGTASDGSPSAELYCP
ncbi:MAG: kelch repeat-containing protein [Polyangiaceae bacterium]